MKRYLHRNLFFLLLAFFQAGKVTAGSNQYHEISYSNRSELREVSLTGSQTISSFKSPMHAIEWISYQSKLLRKRIPSDNARVELLRMVHYESVRNQLDPDLVLALIEVESGFNRFAISHVGASGLMQVMPFWKDLIGHSSDSLFDMQTNLRYGCIILRHYLDMEKNNLSAGLARYNGSYGQDVYSSAVLNIWQNKYRFVSIQ